MAHPTELPLTPDTAIDELLEVTRREFDIPPPKVGDFSRKSISRREDEALQIVLRLATLSIEDTSRKGVRARVWGHNPK